MDREKLIGIITERHYSRNVILKGKTSPTTLVRELLLEGDRVIGIVSIGDLLKSIISKQKFVIDELEHYIHG